MSNEMMILSAFARRDDDAAMAAFFEPVAVLGIREEIAERDHGITFRHDAETRRAYLFIVNPEQVACFTVTGVSLEQAAEIFAVANVESARTTDDVQRRLERALETVAGGTVKRVN